MQKFIVKISQAAELPTGEDICCYLADDESNLKALQAAVSSNLLTLGFGEHAADICLKNNLDGAVLEIDETQPVKKQVAAFREKIGAKKFFGAVIKPSRHIAMLVSETEPDFVAFRIHGANAADREIIKWYNELFLIQSAALCEDVSEDFAALGCDFVLLSAEEYKILVDKIKRLD